MIEVVLGVRRLTSGALLTGACEASERLGQGCSSGRHSARTNVGARIVSYGSSLACNASSFGSPADSRSPVALRSPLARTLPLSWCGRFPAG